MATRGVLYTTPRGFSVRDFSNSQFNEYSESPAKFKWKRIHGYRERIQRAAMKFGIDLQEAIRRFYKEGDNPEEVFAALWLRRQTEGLDYGKDTWEKFEMQGRGLMKQLVRDADKYPITKPVFLDFKDAVLPKIQDPATGVNYQSIPDIIDQDAKGDFVVDIKAMAKNVDSKTPGLIVMDSQLRTQAATTKIFRAVLWVFNRAPKAAEPLRAEHIVEACRKVLGGTRYLVLQHVAQVVAREINALTIDEAGALLGQADPKGVNSEWRKLCKEDVALKNVPVEIVASLAAECAPEYQIEWHEGTMSEAHAMEAVHDQLSVVPQIQANWFPCRCSMRWPHDAAPRCPFRGLCLTERCPDASKEMRAEWQRITEENLVKWDETAFAGLDKEDEADSGE
jgi:hypothetical protein